MTAVRLFAVAGLAVWMCGCNRQPVPTMAGGKPVSHWIDELNNPDSSHRKVAVEKLGNVGSADPAAFPALCRALKDANPQVRCEAILAVLKFGATAREAVPLLEDLRKNDRQPKVRDYAARALATLRPAGEATTRQ